MRKGSFANICEGENNQFEKKMVRLEQKKEALASSFYYSSFFSGMVKLNTEPSPSTDST